MHQFFYLHNLRSEILKLNFNGKEKAKKFVNIHNKLTLFKSKYYFVNVSQINHLQKLYRYISKCLGIQDFHDELEKSINPLNQLIDRVSKNKFDIFVKCFTLVTLTNAFLSIVDNILRIFIEDKKFDCPMIIGLRIGLIIIFIFTYMIILHRTANLKLKNKK